MEDPERHLAAWAAQERADRARENRVSHRVHRELLDKEHGWSALVDRLTAASNCVRFETTDGRTLTGVIREHGDGFVELQLPGISRAIVPLRSIVAITTNSTSDQQRAMQTPIHTTRPLADALETLVAEHLVVQINLVATLIQREGEAHKVAMDYFTLRHHTGPAGMTYVPFARICAVLYQSEF